MKDLSYNAETTKRLSIITGHYGSGKTNIAVNMAFKLKKHFPQKKVTIVDLDIVNPYFRTSDFKAILEDNDIRVISPTYANSNLDTPVLPAEINAVFDGNDDYVIIDVGGDDAGAIALGRYANQISAGNYDLYYVINERRYQTRDVADAVELLSYIEASSRLKATKVINNTNLGSDTTIDIIKHSFEFSNEICKILSLPLAFCTMPNNLCCDEIKFEPITLYVKPFYANCV